MGKQCLILVLLVAFVTSEALSAAFNVSQKTLTVTGSGSATAVADVAQLTVAVSNTTNTAGDARKNVTTTVQAVTAALSQSNNTQPTVATSSISVSPQSVYNSTLGASRSTGYQYEQLLQVIVQNVTSDKLAAIMDTIVTVRGASVRSIQFGVTSPVKDRMLLEARAKAGADAANSAQLYAKAVNASIGEMLSLKEESSTDSATSLYSGVYDGSSHTGDAATDSSVGERVATVKVTAVYTLMGPVVTVTSLAAPAPAATAGPVGSGR